MTSLDLQRGMAPGTSAHGEQNFIPAYADPAFTLSPLTMNTVHVQQQTNLEPVDISLPPTPKLYPSPSYSSTPIAADRVEASTARTDDLEQRPLRRTTPVHGFDEPEQQQRPPPIPPKSPNREVKKRSWIFRLFKKITCHSDGGSKDTRPSKPRGGSLGTRSLNHGATRGGSGHNRFVAPAVVGTAAVACGSGGCGC